jgi:hypothetical protein
MQRSAEKMSGTIDEPAYNKHALILQYTSLSAIVIPFSSILPIPSPSIYCPFSLKLLRQSFRFKGKQKKSGKTKKNWALGIDLFNAIL